MKAINADPLRFKQIMLNLISNGVKYKRDNGSIFIDSDETENGFLRFSVQDQGKGIPVEDHQRIFEPFNRAGLNDFDVQGTGIGLAIAKQMVELMGGEIGVECPEIGGSKFWFTIPLASGMKNRKKSEAN